jgi:hypothetical protein
MAVNLRQRASTPGPVLSHTLPHRHSATIHAGFTLQTCLVAHRAPSSVRALLKGTTLLSYDDVSARMNRVSSLDVLTGHARLLRRLLPAHEATHARLWTCGIAYEERLRARVEAVCLRKRDRLFREAA